MTLHYGAVGGILLGGLFTIIATASGYTSNIVFYAALTVGCLLGFALWVYSPLPDDNGGLASTDPLRGRYWGIYPGRRWRAPEYVSYHESEPRAIYYYDKNEHVAIHVGEGVVTEGGSPKEANERLEAQL